MAEKTSISWTNSTWNPVRGCSRVSEGCRNCYAERVASRFSGKGQPYEGLAVMKSNGPHWTGEVRLVEEHLEDPLKWRKPRMVFVNSMSDLFHEGLDFGDVRRVFAVMRNASQHVFQVLTKRPARMIEFVQDCMTIWQYSGSTWPFERLYPNVWLGVSVEDQITADGRIPILLRTPAAIRFISAEPLLGPINLAQAGLEIRMSDLDAPDEINLHWAIIGGESGPHARPCDISNVRSLVQQCRAAGVACFVKQLGTKPFMGVKGFGPNIKDKKGGDIAEFPEDLRVRQFPTV